MEEGSAAWFVSVIDNDGELSGTSNLSRLTEDELTVENLDSALSGTRAGDEVVVSVHGQTWSGRLTDDQLTLTFTDARGALVDAAFVRGDATEYNATVADLTAAAADNRSAAEAAAAAQAEAEAREKARQREAAEAQRQADQEAAEDQRQADELEWLAGEVTHQTEALLADVAGADPLDAPQEDLTGLRTEIAELDAAACEDAEWESWDVTFAADDVTYSIDSGQYTLDSIGFTREALAEAVRSLERIGRSTSDSDAAGQAAADADAQAQLAIDDWLANLAGINATTADEVTEALNAASERCGITTTWDGSQPPSE